MKKFYWVYLVNRYEPRLYFDDNRPFNPYGTAVKICAESAADARRQGEIEYGLKYRIIWVQEAE